ncbi:MAG TPA: hypothetical protein VIB00_01340 [Pyrinomonadaceae bacterium]|jgi:hypothetical protein
MSIKDPAAVSLPVLSPLADTTNNVTHELSSVDQQPSPAQFDSKFVVRCSEVWVGQMVVLPSFIEVL